MDGAGSALALSALPSPKRPHLWALYGFARWADEIVDNGAPATRAQELDTWGSRVLADLRVGHSRDPVCLALLHTMRTWQIDIGLVESYLDGMRMSLTLDEHRNYADLRRYMDANLLCVGRQILAILEPRTDEAGPLMDALGTAIYLTDLIQDLGEDLRWGRLCLPLDELAAFEVTRADLERGQVTPAIRELLRFQIERARRLYTAGMAVADLVHPSGTAAVRTAAMIFRARLEQIEARGYDVFSTRPWIGAAQIPSLLMRVGISMSTARLRAFHRERPIPMCPRPER